MRAPSWTLRPFGSVAGQAAGIAREPGRALPLGPDPEGETWAHKRAERAQALQQSSSLGQVHAFKPST